MVATSEGPALKRLFAEAVEKWELAFEAWQNLCAADGSHELALVLTANEWHQALLSKIPHQPRPEVGR